MLYKNVSENPYIKIFQECDFSKYTLFYNKWVFLKFILTRDKKDKLIIHGNDDVKFSMQVNLLFLIFRKDLLSRTSLICWGNNDFLRGAKLLTKLTLGLIRDWTYNRYNRILTLTQGDYKQVKLLYPKAKVQLLPYWSTKKHNLDLSHKHHYEDSNKTVVMISHSGWPENDHLSSFQLIAKFVPNVSVICPLCYGDANYIEKVITAGQDYFGHDFYYFTDLMPREDYDNLLKTIDVYISASKRQTGLSAIYGAMDGGAKVFVTGNLLESLKDDGYIVFSIDALDKMIFKDFNRPLDILSAQSNVDQYNRTHFDGRAFIEGWRTLYED